MQTKTLITVILAVLAVLAAISLQILNANDLLVGKGWLVPWLYAACGALVLLVIFLAYVGVDSNQPGISSSPPLPVRYSQQQVANPVVTQNVNLNVSDQLRSWSAPAARTQPKLRANIKCVETKPIQVQGSNEKLYESPKGLGDFHVVVVCFRNEPIPGEQVEQPVLKAHIIYRGPDGEEITDVPSGLWLAEYKDATSFAAGKKNCLIVLLRTNQGSLKKLWKESYTTQHSWMAGGPLFRISDEVITGPIGSLEINLLRRDGTCVMQAILEVDKCGNGELPRLVIHSTSAT